jgi:hypothetical protein
LGSFLKITFSIFFFIYFFSAFTKFVIFGFVFFPSSEAKIFSPLNAILHRLLNVCQFKAILKNLGGIELEKNELWREI